MIPFSKLVFRNLWFSDLAISHGIMSKITEKFRGWLFISCGVSAWNKMEK
jgi:hypothetical protein